MPIGKRQQSNTTLYTLIIFVALFIFATTFAVIYYVKFEEQITNAASLQNQKNELASSREWNARGTIVGAKQKRETYLGKMVDYVDETVSLIVGGLPEEDISAEAKVDEAKRKFNDILDLLARQYPDIANIDPNSTGLIRVAEILKIELDNTKNTNLALRKQLEQLQNQFDDAMTATQEKEQTLLAEKEKYQQQVNGIQKSYDELKALMEQTTGQQVKALTAQRDEERDSHRNTHQQLLKTQAELKMAEERMAHIQEKLLAIVPTPSSDVAAGKPDGKIMLIDNQAKIVHLNIGSDDRVYSGLTFSVYDKNTPIPKDGRGKAEIEVFNVGKNISAARITRAEKRRPIILDDIIANLIWDSDKTNVFVVAGDFDLDGDRQIDNNAVDKIKALIAKWGGSVNDAVSIDADFIILGSPPKTLPRPSFEELEVYPTAMEEYENSLKKLAHYREIQNQAHALLISVFNAERFLYFIGYKEQATRAGAF